MSDLEAVSIILKVWNASSYLKLCLEALLEHTDSPFELIIIDNGSKPKLINYLRRIVQRNPRIQLIENPVNRGPGFANIQGVKVAANRLICLMDSDVLVPPGWLGRLVNEFQAHPEIKMLSPMQHEEAVFYPFEPSERDSRQVWYEIKRKHTRLSPLEQFLLYSNRLSIEAFESAIRKANPGGIRLVEAPPDFLSACCVLVDGNFAEKVGGIADPDFRGYGSEDVDLCWRIGQAGGLVAKTSSVYVHHFQGASLEDNGVDRFSELSRANQILYAKWKDRLLGKVVQKTQAEGADLVQYLESHFIYSALARNTGFIDDMRKKLNSPNIPEDIVWRSQKI